MTERPEELKRKVWERDGYRCQECGVAVASKNGCKPQTHHLNPRGGDDPENLITLCWTCHATKNSLGHRNLLLNARADEIASHIKWNFWEVGTDLLVYAENLSALELPIAQILAQVQQCRDWLDRVETLTLKAVEMNPQLANNKGDHPYEHDHTLKAIQRGLGIAYWSRHRQDVYDEELRGGS